MMQPVEPRVNIVKERGNKPALVGKPRRVEAPCGYLSPPNKRVHISLLAEVAVVCGKEVHESRIKTPRP